MLQKKNKTIGKATREMIIEIDEKNLIAQALKEADGIN